jgi:hypothetical protein
MYIKTHHRQKIKKLLEEGWDARRQAQRLKREHASELTKKWKKEQARKEKEIEFLLHGPSVRDFRLKNRG